MKFLVISDKVSPLLYQNFDKRHFSDIEFVISCGDLPAYYLNFIVDALNVPCFYVPGNHDELFQTNPPQGWTNLQNKVCTHKGIKIAGMGGSPWYNGESPYQYTSMQVWMDVIKLRLSLLWKNPIDIFVTHSPAFQLGDIQGSNAHVGFKSYLQILDHHTPKLFVYGHAHISYGTPKFLQYKNTALINAYMYHTVNWDEFSQPKSEP